LHIIRAVLIIASLAVVAPAGATTYELGEGAPAVFGTVEHYTATYEDTLTDVARRFSLGYEEIVRANPGIDPWLPGAGKDIVIPGRRILPSGPRDGIIVNLPEHRLYYFPKPKKKTDAPIVITYPVSIGKMDWHTPLGQTRVVSKQKNPTWFPPESVRKEHQERGDPLPAAVKAGPDNPLGAYALRLAITPGAYLIHGTNNPLAVGMAVTHGCMRMYPEDVEALFPVVPVGTKVYIVNEPVKVAFVDGELLLEAHPPVDAEGQTIEPNIEQFSQLLDQALGPTTAAVHWDFARETMQTANGLPTVVGLQADLDPPEPLPELAAPIDGAPVAGVPGQAVPPSATDGTAVQGGAPVASDGSAAPGSSPATSVATPSAPAPSDAPVVRTLPTPVAPSQPPAVTTLPAPATPSTAPVGAATSGARAYGAGDPDAATASSPPPTENSSAQKESETTVATATDHP
jgi:L,D-transpeptidase ErfK/SrfK